MKKIRLPYRKIIQWFFLFFFSIPLAIFIYSYLKGEKVYSSLRGIGFYTLPTILTLIGFTPIFTFRSDDKTPPDKALIKIPILEFYVIMLVGIFAFFVFGGIDSMLEDSYAEGRQMLLIGLPPVIILLLALNSKRVWFKEQLIPSIVAKKLEQKKTDIGAFTYTGSGFSYPQQNGPFVCEWQEVSGIVAYKTDNFAYDTIHLVLKKDNGEEFQIHEDIPGWYIFISQFPKHLTGTDAFWELHIMSPAFAESATMVYEKGKDLMEGWGKV